MRPKLNPNPNPGEADCKPHWRLRTTPNQAPVVDVMQMQERLHVAEKVTVRAEPHTAPNPAPYLAHDLPR